MPRMAVTIDGALVKEVTLTQERTTIGRRPYNDIVLDHLAVSGEHAVLLMAHDGSVQIQDLDSTNGTTVNGQSVQRQALQHGDTVEAGKYRLRFLTDEAWPDLAQAMPPPAPSAPPVHAALVRVISGPATGREVALTKVVTTLGKPGVAVASITRRPHGFVLTHVEGEERPLLNGGALGPVAVALQNGDRIALAGAEMEFRQV